MSAFFPVPRQCFPVTLGDLTIYATAWRLWRERQYRESGSVNGGGFVTNFSKRTRRLELKGKLYFRDTPADTILPLDAAIEDATRYQITLRGMNCFAVTLIGYTVEECAESGVLSCTLEFVIQGTLTEAEEEAT